MAAVEERVLIDVPGHLGRAGDIPVDGAVLAHVLCNLSRMTTRSDAGIVRRVNLMKGRSPDQVGSVLTTCVRVRDLLDWPRRPAEIESERVLDQVDDGFGRGPIGLRGSVASHMPDHLTCPDNRVRTMQPIARC